MTVTILDAARAELDDVFDHYAREGEGLGIEFLQEFEHSVQTIVDFPESWEKKGKRARLCQMRRFPYGIVYAILSKDEIRIIAVAHLHRRPTYWRDRLKQLPREP